MAAKEKKKEESALAAMSRRIGENIQSQLQSVIAPPKPKPKPKEIVRSTAPYLFESGGLRTYDIYGKPLGSNILPASQRPKNEAIQRAFPGIVDDTPLYDKFGKEYDRSGVAISYEPDKSAMEKAEGDIVRRVAERKKVIRNMSPNDALAAAFPVVTAPPVTAKPVYREDQGTQRSPQERQMTAPPSVIAPTESAKPVYREDQGTQRSPQERQMTAPPAVTAPKALIVPEDTDLTEKAAALFQRTHGSAFDPKSSKDKKKMASIQSLLSQEGSDKLTPNQFALRIYRTTK
jgi:hypothetical protein